MTAGSAAAPGRVLVIGAGVIGAGIAARLAERGAEVVLVAADDSGSTPVSRASFAWVNAHAKSPSSYRRLNEHGRSAHAERSAAHRIPWFRRVGALADGTVYPDDGYVDTGAYLAAQRDDLLRAGGALRTGPALASLADARRRFGPSDVLVVAAGSGTAALVRHLPDARRVQCSTGPTGFLARIRVADHPIDRILSADGLQLRPDGDGAVAAQSLRLEDELRDHDRPASDPEIAERLRREIAHATGWRVPDGAPVRFDHAPRPSAADGAPVLGRVAPDVYVALTHSGVTLAPLLSDMVARDLCGDSDPRLTPFRP